MVAESSALSNDSNYKELYQVRDNLFLSHGNIIVRLDKIYRFPVLIVYPEATPYVLPSIYPLNEILTEEQVVLLAKGTIEDLHAAILPDVKFYYNLRHQNQSGSLCVLEWDNLDDGSKFYGISTILKRVRDWCSGLITGRFPPDSQETEFCAHFNNIDFETKFFYPETFLKETFIEGEAYGLVFKYLPKGKYSRHDRRSFIGCLIVGKTKKGLYENIDFTLPNFFFEEGIKNAIDLVNKADSLKRFIDSGRLLKSFWFQINKEPNPFFRFQELLAILGEGDYDTGLKRIMPYYSAELKLKPEHFFISVRFPNRKGRQEFQLFKVLKKQEELSGALIGVSDEEAFKHIINSYDLVYAIQCELFSDESFHQRNLGRVERSILRNSAVNIIGVGALGSEIADMIGKAGIGTIGLFDNQEMKGPNPIRHLAGLDYVGAAKVEAVAEIVNNHNPFVNIKVFGGNINSIDLNDLFIDQSIAISSIADDNTEGYLNERGVISNKVIYYVRALRGGKAARIFRVIPGTDACFNCLNLYRNEGKEFIDIPEDLSLPTLKNECNNPIRPASSADLKLISAITSRIVLDELQQTPSSNNHWIWTTDELGSLQPYQLLAQSIKPHPGCYYCNHEKNAKVILSKAIEKQIQELIAKNPKIETGGVLAGHLSENGDFIITNASGPGPKATHSSTKFEKDVEYCQKFLDELFIKSQKQVVYIGEWHSHPNENNKPSGTDLKSLTEIAFQKEYLTDMPVMLIFSNTGVPSCTVHPAGKRYYFTDLIIKK